MSNIEFKDNTEQFLAHLASAKKRGLKAIGMTAERYAKRETPVDTGRLRNSISNTADKDAAYIGTNVEYTPYVELGARGRNPVYMLRKAATEHTPEYKDLLEKSMKNAYK